MKNEQFISFETIITFAKQHEQTNLSSDFDQYHFITGNTIIDFITSYFDDRKLEFNTDDEQLQEYLSEWADSNIPVYYSELTEWFSKNWTAIDEYIECFGSSPDTEIMQIIQAAYCWTLENAITSTLHNIKQDIISKTD